MNLRTRLDRLRRRVPPPSWAGVLARDADARQKVEEALRQGKSVMLVCFADEERPNWYEPEQTITLKWGDDHADVR